MAIKPKTQVVKFSDGSQLEISEENWDIAGILNRLEEEARELPPLEDINSQIFRLRFYPRMKAAVVKGEIPTEEEARKMPSAQLDLWYRAVYELNPHWWAGDNAAEPDPVAEGKKKKRIRRK